MKRMGLMGLIGLIAAAVIMGLSGVGCDTVTDSSGVITMDPPLVTVTGRFALVMQVIDTNGTLYLPLKWSVSDASLGSVTGQGGLTALYQSNDGVGINTVTVRDQADAEGFGVINHVSVDGLTVTPDSALLRGTGALVQFTVSSDPGVALPLVWSNSNPGLGSFATVGGYGAVYMSAGQPGLDIITVSDQLGAQGTAIVQHM
ncbi:MAG: hypothetical protein HQ523_12555 [Lentisphaerae bacterium]|nr:hypothetical protein [Lentisphaerota bacterium]